ncbi:uncharacterized protein BDZ99DRAFT_511263 [Mytilinidion resinicola]|uniref:Kinetochore protein Sos7 coiled-coil domain-containing protein n=1 Tax=Mytilinidion resinicola TaxID=574789 RepID=A0A6A6Y8S8_9PEZI|nr:uncharacterized protein BDZ99DRAFT_511263 [Mytilinidion resinicola]KAF2805221.1 hypothetical protein BDZ99DRAFT_511263 [Mytilinidion resinicola]
MASDTAAALKELQSSHPLNLIELSDSIRPSGAQDAEKRSSAISDTSANAFENATPAGLEADLIHYKELFSKLRFSYVEQVTKEKFLRAITDNPPLFIEASENAALEAQLAEAKAALKAQKVEVAELIKQLESRGRNLSNRYESVTLRTTSLATLPAEISTLESAIASLKHAQAPHPTNPSLSLPLPETLELLQSKEAELAALDAELARLQTAVPRKTHELERIEAELRPLEAQKTAKVAAAVEARRRREQGGGIGDELEERGRWLRASEAALKGMLEV